MPYRDFLTINKHRKEYYILGSYNLGTYQKLDLQLFSQTGVSYTLCSRALKTRSTTHQNNFLLVPWPQTPKGIHRPSEAYVLVLSANCGDPNSLLFTNFRAQWGLFVYLDPRSNRKKRAEGLLRSWARGRRLQADFSLCQNPSGQL